MNSDRKSGDVFRAKQFESAVEQEVRDDNFRTNFWDIGVII
jgi:hypothetical protein